MFEIEKNINFLSYKEAFALACLNNRRLNNENISSSDLSLLERYDIDSRYKPEMRIASASVHGLSVRGQTIAKSVYLEIEDFSTVLHDLNVSSFVPFIKSYYRTLSNRRNYIDIINHCIENTFFDFVHTCIISKDNGYVSHFLFNFHPTFLFHTHSYLLNSEVHFCYECSAYSRRCKFHNTNPYFYD